MKDDYQGVPLDQDLGKEKEGSKYQPGREDLGCRSTESSMWPYPRTGITIESYPKLPQETFIDPGLMSHWIHTLEGGGTMGKSGF